MPQLRHPLATHISFVSSVSSSRYSGASLEPVTWASIFTKSNKLTKILKFIILLFWNGQIYCLYVFIFSWEKSIFSTVHACRIFLPFPCWHASGCCSFNIAYTHAKANIKWQIRPDCQRQPLVPCTFDLFFKSETANCVPKKKHNIKTFKVTIFRMYVSNDRTNTMAEN